MRIALCTHGSVGITVIRKLFELGFAPTDILVLTHDVNTLKNRTLIEFLNYFRIEWFSNEGDMVQLSILLSDFDAEMVLSVSYKYIFKDPVLNDYNTRLINLHPGVLPDYRGCFSIPWALINGETFVGYTYHLIDGDIDTGDLIQWGVVPIQSTSTAFDLHFKVMALAIDRIGGIVSGNWTPWRQAGKGTYYKNVFPTIDPSWDEKKKERFSRASYFPPFNI